jgi:hypothetical protein
MRYLASVLLVLSICAIPALTSTPAVAAGTTAVPEVSTLDVLGTLDTLPSSWIGVWSIHTTQTDCTTNFVYFDQTLTDTLCADANIQPDSTADLPVSCTAQVDANSFHVICDATYPVEPGSPCMATFHEDVTGSVNGDSYTSSGTFTISYSDSCSNVFDTCINISSTGSRTSSDPGVCANTPVEPVSWGLLKSRYE